MSSIPYQSTYALAPKYGTRYGPSQFAAATAPVASPETLGVQVPAVATVGAGIPGTVAGQQQAAGAVGQVAQAAAQPLTYSQDPFAYSGTVNGQTQAGTGFRPAGDYTYAPPTDTPYVPPTSPPPVTVTAGPNTQASNLIESGGLSDEGPGYDYAGSRTAQAQALGYERGTQNPLGLVPYVGSFLTSLDGPGDYTYGQEGTYDAQGNVFGPAGRAYDPITGRAVASYGTKTDAFNTVTDGYGKLRDAGEGVVSSALGSYDNSVYKQMDLDPTLNIQGARAARNRGVGAPINTVAGMIEANTALTDPQEKEANSKPITPDMLGFTGQRLGEPTSTTGKFGSGVGDIVALQGGEFGVRKSDGTISTPSGTVVQVSDTATGESISLLGGDARNELRANQELDARAGNQNMSGFIADDSAGETYQTDSSGTSGAFTGGYTGMEDEYDDPSPTGSDGGSDGGK